MVKKWRMWLLAVIVLPLGLFGCVSSATARKIDLLEAEIKEVVAEHKAGTITTDQAIPRLESLVEQVKGLRESEEPWYAMLGYWVMTSLLTVVGARKLGIPGIAHGTGLPMGRHQ